MSNSIDAKGPLEFLEALRPLFDALSDGVCVADLDGRLLYANDAAGRLLGPAAEQAGERSICELLCGGLKGTCGETAAACPLKIREGPRDSATFAGTFGRTGRDLRARCLRVRLARGEKHFIVIEDATAEAERRRQQEDMRQMFAHDVRAPLTNALGVLRTLEDHGSGHVVAPADVELIRLGVRGCSRIAALVDAYLETSRLEESAMPVRVETVEVGGLIRECVAEERAAARARGLELSCAVPAALNARVDRELLRRALINLIGNALKFTPAGGRITVGAEPRGGSAWIRVADDGPGISARDLPHIFERFYQGASGERRSGFGLGLTFCRAASLAMGGEVSVESEEGKGSVFTLRLPLNDAQGAAS